MTDKVYLLSQKTVERSAEVNRRILGALPRAPKLKRRVYGGYSNAYFVKFTVSSYDEYTGGFWCTVRYRLCGSSIPGITDDGEILVYDVDGCLFDDEETTDLIGRKGDAVYMSPEESIDPYGECIWVVTGLCCPE